MAPVNDNDFKNPSPGQTHARQVPLNLHPPRMSQNLNAYFHPQQMMQQPMQAMYPQTPVTQGPGNTPAWLSTYNTASDTVLPTQQQMIYARISGKHIYEQYHPNGGEITNDANRAAAYEDLDENDLPRSRDLVSVKHLDAGSTYFPDALTAEFYRDACRPAKKSGPDPTVPTNTPAMQVHVLALVRAFNSYRWADDNEGMLKPFKQQRHDQKLVEAMCWQLLKAIIWRSQSEEPLCLAWEPSKARNSVGLDNFAERFDAVINSMVHSKTICKHLFDAPYAHIFVDDPDRARSRVKANRDLNKQKALQMSAGKRFREEEAKLSGSPVPPSSNKRARGTPRYDSPSAIADAKDILQNTPIRPDDSPFGVPPQPPNTLQSNYTASDTTPRRSARQTRRPESYAPAATTGGDPFSVNVADFDSPGGHMSISSGDDNNQQNQVKNETLGNVTSYPMQPGPFGPMLGNNLFSNYQLFNSMMGGGARPFSSPSETYGPPPPRHPLMAPQDMLMATTGEQQQQWAAQVNSSSSRDLCSRANAVAVCSQPLQPLLRCQRRSARSQRLRGA